MFEWFQNLDDRITTQRDRFLFAGWMGVWFSFAFGILVLIMCAVYAVQLILEAQAASELEGGAPVPIEWGGLLLIFYIALIFFLVSVGIYFVIRINGPGIGEDQVDY